MKVFPIKTATACVLKWAWSTVYLGQGTTSSCHRVDQHTIDHTRFGDFHNQPEKIQAREQMLAGKWPQAGCQYCEKIEAAGGMSDRLYQLSTVHEQDHAPAELAADPTVTSVVPTILEIYFNNTCNMACVYCGAHFSSKWAEENRRFGEFRKGRVHFGYSPRTNPHYERMLADFWVYLEHNYQHIRYFQVLGGEPFYQTEFDTCLEFWEAHPSPDLVFNIITNLKVAPRKFQNYIDRLTALVQRGHLKRLQITGSIDAWGPEEEYVRWGLDLEEWQANWEYCLDKPEIVLSINAAITALTIKTLPDLIERINAWDQVRPAYNPINFSFMSATNPAELVPDIFGTEVFAADFERVLAVMPCDTEKHRAARDHMTGIIQQIQSAPQNNDRIADLKVFLTELDRRRGTDWTKLFPWLVPQGLTQT